MPVAIALENQARRHAIAGIMLPRTIGLLYAVPSPLAVQLNVSTIPRKTEM